MLEYQTISYLPKVATRVRVCGIALSMAAAAFLGACGNKGDLYLELDEQVEQTINELGDNRSESTQSQSADVTVNDGDDDQKARDPNKSESER